MKIIEHLVSHTPDILQSEKKDMLQVRWGFVVGMRDFQKLCPKPLNVSVGVT